MGDLFEELFARACQMHDVTFTVIPDGARTVYRLGRLSLVRCKTPFDYFITKGGKSAALDCKTVVSGNFAASQVDPDQLRELLKLSHSIPAGYVILYRDINRVMFYPAPWMAKLKRRESLKPEDGIYLGRDTDFDPRKILDFVEITVPYAVRPPEDQL